MEDTPPGPLLFWRQDETRKTQEEKEKTGLLGISMPAVSKAQRRATAIAEHAPSKLFKRNRGLLKMDKADLHKFASTKEKKLMARSTKGSPSMDVGEMGKGYRVLQICPMSKMTGQKY